ncbi:PKD-like domain-containing protein [Flavobacterium sp. XGLA_31]|uniref:PKD-like domain-containing protein n=1 Tax=Flavobacterium sp. XGLA_31 TaxID=3447666 RepID=UPI003F3536C7
MKQIYIVFLLLLGLHFGYASEKKAVAATATITGTTTVCQNSASPLITFTGSGGVAPYTFTYTVTGTPGNQTISTTGTNSTVTLSAPTGMAGTFTYTLVSVTDSSPPPTPISVSGSAIITVNFQANANLNSSATADSFNGFPVFKICSNQTTDIDFFNASTTLITNTNYSISWGDGSPNFTATSWNTVTHSYAVGLWTMVYTITAQNGCNVSKTYKVFVGNNPAVGLGNPGNTDVCITSALTFPITGTENNPPGTTYTVTFNDGSPPTIYNHPPPSSITHNFLISSCNVTSTVGSTYQNSFYASIIALNPCDQSSATVVPIRISTPPVADFNLPQITKCTNSQICLTNTSTGGDAASSSGCTAPKIIWTIVPNTGFNVTSGSLGNDFGSSNTNSWTGGTSSICLTFLTPGNYSITMKIGNRCGVDQKTKNICVEAPLTPQFNLNTITGCTPVAVTATNNTSITNSCTPPTYLWHVTYATAYCGTTAPTIPDQTTANASYTFTEPGTYTIKLTVTNSCGSFNTTQTVTVKKPPTVSLAAISNTCGSASITPNATVTNCAPSGGTLTYAWSFPGGTPSSSTAANPGIINYPAGGPYTVSLVVTNECGPSNTATQTFTVNTAPVITNASLGQTICSGSTTTLVNLTANPTGTTFSWTASATAGVSGYTSSGTSNTIPVQTITTTNTSPGTVTYVITPTIGTCSGTPVNYVITVNPAPTITTQPASSSVCLGGSPTPLTVTLNSSSVVPAYQWYSNTSNSTSGGTLIPGATNATYNPPATTAGTLYYYCVLSLSSGGCSNLTTNVATVTVNPLPTITTQPLTTQNICVGGSIPALSVAYIGGVGTATYQWYSNTTSATTGGTMVGTNAATYTPAAFTTAGTYYYYVVISLSGNGCGSVTSSAAEIVVVADPILTTQPLATQTLCQNATASALTVVASGGVGSFSYQWYSNSSASTSGATLIPSAVNATYTPLTTAVGTKYYFCIIGQTGLGCAVTSSFAQVIVNASPTIQNQPVSSTVCSGGIPTTLSLTYTNGVGTPTYQWYSNTSNATTGGTLLSGETNPTFTPPGTMVGTVYYYCVVSFPALTGSCAVVTTNVATVTVDAGAVVTQQPLPNQSLCVGAAIPTPLTVAFSGGTGTPSYQWYSNTTNTTTGGTVVGTNSASYTPPVFSTPGSYYYYVVISLNGSGCGNITSQVAQITVVADPIITAQPLATQTQCQSSATTPLVVTANGGIGTFSYQWYSNGTPSNSGGILITGATTDTYSPPATTVGTFYYYCVVSQTGLGCSVTSSVATVVVVPSPVITTQPQSAIVCAGTALSPLTIAYSNGTGTASYQWYDDNGIIVGATAAAYTPTNTVTTSFYCVITFSSGGCTNITSNTATITINPAPVIDQQPSPVQSVCVGGSIGALTVSYIGGVGTASYQWYSNTTNTTTGGTAVGTNSASYTPPAYTTSGNYYYYVVISFSSGGCGSVISSPAEVNVVADPTIIVQPQAIQTVCQNSPAMPLSVAASGGIGTIYSYQWYSSTVNSTTSGTLLTGETNSTYTPPTSIAGTLYYYCMITQPGGTGCNATSAVAAVTVNLAPAVVNQPPSSTICLGATPTTLSLTYANGSGIPNYQWYSNTTNSNSGGTPISGATGATYNPPATSAGTSYYYCEVTFPTLVGSCSLITTNAAEVIINQYPVIAPETTIICSSNAFTITPTTASGNIIPTGTTYTWTTPVINPSGAVTGASSETTSQSSISQTLVNLTTSPATVTYTVTPIAGSCAGSPFTVTVTVNPSINPNVVVTNNSCFGVNTASITTNITGGIPFSSGTPYQLSWIGPNGYTSSATSISGVSPGIYTVTITDAGGCPFSNSYTITEPADIVITTNSENDITCYSASNGSIDITVTGGTGAYTYNWTKNTAPFAVTEDLSNLSPGTYVVTVTDVNNCGPKTATFTITEPPLLVVSLVSQTNVLCYGAATGAINVSIIGGTPNPTTSDYSYVWSGPNGFTANTQNINNLFAGTYDLTVTDFNGCAKNLIVTITQSTDIVITYTTTPITCYGANNASMTVTLSGGNAPYTYQWSNLSTALYQDNLSAGNYTITVTDNVGCIKTATIVIPEAPVFMVNPIVTQITCHGAHNGSINLNLTGGIAPVALTWSDGSTAGLIRNNLGPGTYTATISDGTPCYIIRTFTIVEPQALVVSSNLINAFDCTDASSGAIDLVVAGGTMPYTYVWSNGAATEDLTDLTSGTYAVTVTDANSCIATAQYTIVRQDPLAIAVTTQTDFDCAAHSVNQNFVAQASGGIPPYQFQWSSGVVSGANHEIMHTNANGTVLLTVTDSNACTATYTVNVDTPVLGYPSFDTTSYGYITYGIYAIGDPIQFQSTVTGDYESVIWDFGDGTFSSELNPVHTYLIPKDYIVTQTVTYPFGCVYVQTISLLIEKGYVLVVPTAFTPNNDTVNDTYRPVTKALKNIKLDIYDTWGSLIYSETGDVLVGWNGKIKGFDAENGNYYSKVSAETFYGQIVNSNQTFVLIK